MAIFFKLFSMGSEDLSTIQANDSLSLTMTDGPSAKKAKLEIRIQMLIDQLKSAKRAEEICIRFGSIWNSAVFLLTSFTQASRSFILSRQVWENPF